MQVAACEEATRGGSAAAAAAAARRRETVAMLTNIKTTPLVQLNTLWLRHAEPSYHQHIQRLPILPRRLTAARRHLAALHC